MSSRSPATTLGRGELSDALRNMGWLGASRLFQVVVAFVVGAWVARHLGPERYGLLAYAVAWVTLFASVAMVGGSTVLVRNFVAEPEQSGTAFGTALGVRVLLLLASAALAVGVAWFDRRDSVVFGFIGVLAIAQCVKASAVVDFWFQARVQSKVVVLANVGTLFASGVARIVLILTEADLAWFVWAVVLEWVIQALLLSAAFVRYGGLPLSSVRPSWAYAKVYFADAWPMALSGIASTVYLRIDQVMLEAMSTPSEVGTYAVAAGLIQSGYFVPTMICGSLFPALVRARRQDPVGYRIVLQRLFTYLLWLGMGAAVALWLAAPLLTVAIWGDEFSAAAPVLEISGWSLVFVFLMIGSGRHLIAENETMIVMFRPVVGALVNVAANWLLIPMYAGRGAAFATVLSFFAAAVLSNLPFARARWLVGMFVRALDPRHLRA